MPCCSVSCPSQQRLHLGSAAPVLALLALGFCGSGAVQLPEDHLAAAPQVIRVRVPNGATSALSPYGLTPRRRALLNTIRYAEGTWVGGSLRGYHRIYGGGSVASLRAHPRISVSRRYTSAAAGAYQFLPRTWDEVSARLRLRDFSPRSQDQAALYLVERRGALAALDRQGLNPRLIHKLAPEWASLPAAHGGSAYGQPVKPAEELLRFYQASLQREQRNLSQA